MNGAELRSDRLRVFMTVAEERGFSRAARALGLTQSAVSQSIAVLEEELQEPLFLREGRTVTLTEAGRVLRLHAARVFQELAAAKEELLARRAVTSGSLSIGTTDTLATYVLPPALAGFRKRFSAIDLRLVLRPSPAIALQVALHKLDVGVVSLPLPARLSRSGRITQELLRTEVLLEQRDVAIVPKGHPLAKRAHVSLAELAHHPLLLLDHTTATRAALDAKLEALSPAPRVIMEMGSVEVLKRLVSLGFGVSVVPEAATQDARASGFVALQLEGAPKRAVGVVFSASGQRSHAARAFIDVLRAALLPS